MEKLKKIIIILSILVIIVFIFILILKNTLHQNEEETYIQDEKSDISGDFIKQLGIVEDYVTFFSIENMLNNYIMKVEYANRQTLYNLTDAKYIEENNVTQENILDNMADISPYASKARIRKLYERKNLENTYYYIKCILEKEHKGKEFYFILCEDEQNSTYSIEKIDAETYEQKITKVDKENEAKIIEKNAHNKKILVNPTEEEIAKKYFKDFLENALYYPEYAYDSLDSEYRDRCFPTLQDFKDYIENKRGILESYDVNNLKQSEDFETVEEYREYMYQVERLKLDSYQIRKNETYNRYICIDSKKNYYTFYATFPLNYTVVLGNYVTPNEHFVEEYNTSSDVEKVILNIKRFFMGIDDKNYGYSYSVLSGAFKNNKYPTKNDFVNYTKQNFFEENEIKYISCEEENGVYIYKIKLTDATGTSSEEKIFNMIVKLNSGTDFEMSFGE